MYEEPDFKLLADIGDQFRIYCNWCQQPTNHFLKALHRSPVDWYLATIGEIDRDAVAEDAQYVEYRLWHCAGCDTGTFEIIYNEGEPYAPSARWLTPRQYFGVGTKTFHHLPSTLKAIYEESIYAYNHNKLVLCTIGLRALLEGICKDKGITGRNLKDKIDGLNTLLPQHIVDNLHVYRKAGNEAAHELQPQSQFNLRQYIDLIEDLLNFLYELDHKASRIDRTRQ